MEKFFQKLNVSNFVFNLFPSFQLEQKARWRRVFGVSLSMLAVTSSSLILGCESERKKLAAQASAQAQINQLQLQNQIAKADWDEKAQVMLLIAKVSTEHPQDAKTEIENTFQRMNKKYPVAMRKLASNPENQKKLKRILLGGFKSYLLSVKDLKAHKVELAAKLKEFYSQQTELMKTEHVVEKGQTLQKISFQLYGSHRRWPEIYLLNHEKIANWDVIEIGMPLEVYARKPEVILAPVATKRDDE